MRLTFEGRDLEPLDAESGGHSVQRQQQGRTHTSLATISVLDPDQPHEAGPTGERADGDFRIDWYNGTTKAGGQHHQKNATCCRITHLPTGLVRTAQTRSRQDSLRSAMAALLSDLDRHKAARRRHMEVKAKRDQVQMGERGQRRRTYRFQEDAVIDHKSGKRARLKDVLKGNFEALWPA